MTDENECVHDLSQSLQKLSEVIFTMRNKPEHIKLIEKRLDLQNMFMQKPLA